MASSSATAAHATRAMAISVARAGSKRCTQWRDRNSANVGVTGNPRHLLHLAPLAGRGGRPARGELGDSPQKPNSRRPCKSSPLAHDLGELEVVLGDALVGLPPVDVHVRELHALGLDLLHALAGMRARIEIEVPAVIVPYHLLL